MVNADVCRPSALMDLYEEAVHISVHACKWSYMYVFWA